MALHVCWISLERGKNSFPVHDETLDASTLSLRGYVLRPATILPP
jgi:hypothetical protein